MAAKRTVRKAKVTQNKKEVLNTSLAEKKSFVLNNYKSPKFFIPLIIIILAFGAFFLRGLFIVALVNGQPISRLSIIQELEKQSGQQAMAARVNQTLILQEAKKKNVDVSQEEIDKSIKTIEEDLKKQGQNLDTALSAQGMTREDLIMQLKLRTLVEKLLADKVKVTDKEINDYIEKNKETFPTEMKEEEVKAEVKQQLEQQKMATESQTWIAELNKNAKINYFVNY
ncbi:MAG: SurA N-terminal domain-containing protein [Candidatus Levybacteria bacterium]|nr:SurA N-terminal domain-containing protein [Candidatus Levybacteria bacterium]MDZ4228592.1 SurA N-terminal domain-containing protein [Candidatus Levybacteria bacterium]